MDRQIVDMAEFMLTRRLSIRMFWGLDVGGFESGGYGYFSDPICSNGQME